MFSTVNTRTSPAREVRPAPACWIQRVARAARGLVCHGSITCLAACSTVHYPINAALSTATPAAAYSLAQPFKAAGDEGLTIVLTFSGGGSRAAALAFGVVEELARQQIVWRGVRKRLIDEVDMVYGVSGGSMLATYWSLRGDAVLTEFPEHFLRRDIQQHLMDDLTTLGNLWRLGSPRFGRGDLLAERLDQSLFAGATFGDLARTRQGPFTVISATDLSNGTRFDFVQEYFDLLCSDLGTFPLARAVAASSAVPLLFTPITLWNHGRDCVRPLPLPAQTAALTRGGQTLTENRAQRRLNDLVSYLAVDRHPYVHLVDGGVADNLALRSVLELEGLSHAAGQTQPVTSARHISKALFIVVDAGTDPIGQVEQSADIPHIPEVVAALTDIPVQRYSDETRYLFQQTLAQWRHDARQAAEAAADDPLGPLHMVEVSLQAVADTKTRQQLLAMPTTLYLPPADVQLLRETGARMLRESPEFQRLIHALGSPAPP